MLYTEEEKEKSDFKINWLTAVIGLIFISSILMRIWSEIFHLKMLSFTSETILLTVGPPSTIWYSWMRLMEGEGRVTRNIVRILIASILLIYLIPVLYARYADFPAVFTHNYSHSEGEAKIVSIGKSGYIKFILNNTEYSVFTHNYDSILKKDNNIYIDLEIDYLPNSNYIMDIKQ